MKRQTALLTLGLLLATSAVAGGGGAPAARPPAAACKSIAQIVSTDPNFSTLASALDSAGLRETLMSGEYTVFAPNNAAFAKLPSDQLAAAMNDPETLRSILLYHVVPGKVSSAQVRQASSINTVQGSGALVTVSGNKVMVDNATVTKADIAACNGIIHVVDTVLMPAIDTEANLPQAPAEPAPAATPAAEPAPAATAPAATPTVSALSIPVLPAGASAPTTSTASTATTTATATTTTATTTTTTDTSTATTDVNASTQAIATNTCYDAIVADDRFSILRDMLSDAGLTDSLMTDNLTLFAPTNDAFDAMNQDQLALISSDPEALKQLLTYHIVPKKVTAEQLTAGDLTSTEGSSLTVTADGNNRLIGKAKVDTQAVVADNCLIYPLSAVLMPDDFNMPEAPVAATGSGETGATTATTATSTTTATTTTLSTGGTALVTLLQGQPQFSTLLGLIQKAGLVDTLVTGEHTLFAPTNDAFNKLSPTDFAALQADPAQLKALLLNHVVAQRIGDSSLSSLSSVTTAQGSALNVTKSGDLLKIGDATINGASSINSSDANLTIYPIDTVLLPK